MDWSYWTAYWWMLLLGVAICTTACAASVEGATMFTPLFALGFPLLGASALTPGQAIATALIIESVGYSSGLIGHARQRAVVWSRVRTLGVFAVPAAAVTATVAHALPGPYLLLGVAAVLVALGVLVLRGAAREGVQPAPVALGRAGSTTGALVRTSDGRLYGLSPDRRPLLTHLLTGLAGGVTGLVGIGIGEATSSQLMLRLNWPARVAIGTSVGVVLQTVVTAGAIQAALLARSGLEIPWNLVVWTLPAVLIGGQLGPRVTALVPERRLRCGLGLLFILLSGSVVASTLGRLAR